ncbi:MAG: chemotaxis protein CheW [Solirubrobacterales bacterium]
MTQKQFITFTIGDEEYGVDIMAIREIKGWTATTALPNAPAYMRGVINLRGAIIPILDLKARFGRGPAEPSARNVIIVVAVGTRLAGLLVDAVADILAVQDTDIQPVPELEHSSEKFLAGLVTVEGRMVALLDLDIVFDLDTAPTAEAQLAVA